MQPTVQAGNQRPEPVKPKITITTFGTLQVTRDELAVTESDWHTRQARQLLLDAAQHIPAVTDLGNGEFAGGNVGIGQAGAHDRPTLAWNRGFSRLLAAWDQTA